MRTLKQACKLRSSVFDRSKRDIVLDLTDLIQDCMDPEEFFEENYLTDGMKRLLREAFRRFEGKSAQGVFKLTQAMGGGKTHNLIALGLLARHFKLRKKVMGDLYESKNLGEVRVVAFSGRESDAPLGIWGSLADQLGKKDVFKDYYSPLSAPGQTAWVNLLKGEPLLILLDELPPYFQNARSKAIGNSDLSEVTTTALANLLVAVGKDELSNVCVVISDLRATYEQGTQQINRALQNLENEVGRTALSLEPVGLNTDEIYHILRKRIFVKLPDKDEIKSVAQGYAQAVRDAKQMDITQASPEKFAQQILESYPFHPAIKDLYARFRENPGFQQTRGLIRLMRTVVSRLYDEKEGKADKICLISAHDIDLNDRETLSEITQINPTLDNAISHDLASRGKAVAEIMDANLGGTDAQDACKLILISSLANIPNALLGLSDSEIVSYLCAPGRDISRIRADILSPLSTRAWYLHLNREGKLFFKNVENLVAKLKTRAESYNQETSLRELRKHLEQMFEPRLRDCYQEILALPAVDEINIKPDKVTLVISEPYTGGGLHPSLQKFYEDLAYKNRILFLSGQRGTMEALLDRVAELKAIISILDEMERDKVPENDPQFGMARDLQDKLHLQFLSAARETFTILTYPHGDGLMTADFLMNFKNNEYHGEQQIRETLKSKQKFTEDITGNIFRRKCEDRLFTQKIMPWSEIKKRTATNIKWQWHRMDALDNLKNDLVSKDQWRENGGYVEKPPFPKPQTEVRVQETSRDDNTGVMTLKLTPVNGDIIYYDVGGAKATTASSRVPDPKKFETRELIVSFLCVNSKDEHETGESLTWRNRITIKSRIFQSSDGKMVELQATPAVPIRYTTDGSDPKIHGGAYHDPLVVPPGAQIVLAVAEKDGIISDIHRLSIDWAKTESFKVDLEHPVTWRRFHSLQTTQESYAFLDKLKKYRIILPGPRVTVVGHRWVELSVDKEIDLTPEKVEEALTCLRGLLSEGQVSIEVEALKFLTGQSLLDWVKEMKTQINPREVEQ
jgi:hypothetical protein